MMMPQWATLVASRIVAASTTPPSVQGMIGVAEGLAGFGVCAAVSMKSGATSDFIISPAWDGDEPSFSHTLRTFGRVLIIPSLVEEVLWRVALLPHPIVDGVKFAPLPLAFGATTCFSLYHVVGGHLLSKAGRPGAVVVFQRPAFLLLAFFLGGACTYSYYIAGGALYAPVLVHAIPVTLWLTYFGGEDVLKASPSVSLTDCEERDALNRNEK